MSKKLSKNTVPGSLSLEPAPKEAKARGLSESAVIDAQKGMSGPFKKPEKVADWTGKRAKEFSPYLIPQVDESNGKTVYFVKATPRGILGGYIEGRDNADVCLEDAQKAWNVEKERVFSLKESASLIEWARSERLAKKELAMVELECGAYASKERPLFFEAADWPVDLTLDKYQLTPQGLLRRIEWRGMPTAYASGLDRGGHLAGCYYWWGEVPTRLWAAASEDGGSSPLQVAPRLFGDCGGAKYKTKLSDGRSCFAYKGVNGYLVLTINNG